MITRGTTPALTFDIGRNCSDIKELWLTFAKYDDGKKESEIFTKTLSEVKTNETKLVVELTQEETLMLNEVNSSYGNVYIQLRVLTQDEMALCSDILKITVKKLLKEGVIE